MRGGLISNRRPVFARRYVATFAEQNRAYDQEKDHEVLSSKALSVFVSYNAQVL
jgi:hypothetical protein